MLIKGKLTFKYSPFPLCSFKSESVLNFSRSSGRKSFNPFGLIIIIKLFAINSEGKGKESFSNSFSVTSFNFLTSLETVEVALSDCTLSFYKDLLASCDLAFNSEIMAIASFSTLSFNESL